MVVHIRLSGGRFHTISRTIQLFHGGNLSIGSKVAHPLAMNSVDPARVDKAIKPALDLDIPEIKGRVEAGTSELIGLRRSSNQRMTCIYQQIARFFQVG